MKELIKAKTEIFLKRMAAVTPACLTMMVQGNLQAISLDHWEKALTTGAIAATAITLLSFYPNKQLHENKITVAGTTSFLTTVADFITHPSHFWGATGEAIATGIAAGILCIALSNVWPGKNKAC